PALRRHATSRRPHGSMNFRSLAAVNGLRPPEAARAVGRRKTPVFRRAMGRRETPVFRRAMRAPLTAAKLRKQEASIGRMLCIRLESSTALSAEPGGRDKKG